MYDRHLEGFIAAVEYGSFAQAAEAMFITSNALVKQVNILERDLGVTLLERTNRGVVPTEAGRLIYTRAKELIAETNVIVRNAQQLAEVPIEPVRLATSPMRPANRVTAMWQAIAHQHPTISVALVNMPDDAQMWAREMRKIGADFDVRVGARPSSHFDWYQWIDMVDIYVSRPVVMAPVGHHIGELDHVALEDLAHEILWVPTGGIADSVDEYRRIIASQFPSIRMKDYIPFDLATLNDLARTGELVLGHDDLTGIHPAFRYVPLDDGAGFPVSLMFSKDAGPAVREFARSICSYGRE